MYCLCGDGDIQEGISYEACSLAGHHKLDNLICIYDANDITIEGGTSLAFSENVKLRFESQGWNVEAINGHDFEAIEQALHHAKESDRPYLIIAHTVIVKGAVHKAGTSKTHGEPL